MPVFVLTHYERDPVVMEGGTTFHFVQDGIEAALRHYSKRGERRNGGTTVQSSFVNVNMILRF
jgi:hypothetical protein